MVPIASPTVRSHLITQMHIFCITPLLRTSLPHPELQQERPQAGKMRTVILLIIFIYIFLFSQDPSRHFLRNAACYLTEADYHEKTT